MLNGLNTLLLSLLIIGCASAPKKRPPKVSQKEPRIEYARLRKLVASGRLNSSIRASQIFTKKYGDTDLADDASLIVADALFKRRRYQEAFSFYIAVVNSNVYSPQETYALVRAAKILVHVGRLDEALALTQKGLKYKDLPVERQIGLNKIRFNVLNKLGDYLEALEAIVILSRLSEGPEAEEYRQRALTYIQGSLSVEDLQGVINKRRFGKFRAQAYFRLGKSEFENQNFQKAKSYLSAALSVDPDSDTTEVSQNLILQINARQRVSPRTIGVVLPLSGRHASVARKTLRGLQLGLGVFGQGSSDFKLAVMDSGGNPDTARRAAESLVIDDSVIAIVGSLLSKTAEPVAAKANELGIPNISLSQKSGITNIGDFVFRNALTSEMQVSQLVELAINQRGMRRFAILYPNDGYGVSYANIFWDYVLAYGGEIVGAQAYNPKENSFSEVISRLTGTYYLEDRQEEYKELYKEWLSKQKNINTRTAVPKDLLAPIVQFEALFIPDSTKALGQIAPTLAYHDIENISLLGDKFMEQSPH